MINNDVLRSIRYMLDLSDIKVVEITKLADPDFPIEKADVLAFLRREDDPEYVECSGKVLAHFLDGLVIYQRGRRGLQRSDHFVVLKSAEERQLLTTVRVE